MKNSILVKTLMAFSNDELKRLSLFIENRYFNVGSHYRQNIQLFHYLISVFQNGKTKNLNKSTISKVLYKADVEHRNRYLENRMSELLSVIRKFILWQEVEGNLGSAIEGLTAARFYRKRGLYDLHEQMTLRIKRTLDEGFIQFDKPNIHYWFEKEVYALQTIQNHRKGDLNIPRTIESLTVFYATELLNLNLAQIQQNRIASEYKPQWLELIGAIRLVFKQYNFFNNRSIFLLDAAINLMTEECEEPYKKLKIYTNLINDDSHYVPLQTLKNLSAYARNFCIWKINQGHREFKKIRLTLYKGHLVKGWLFENGKIISSTFINMVNMGLWSNEPSWVNSLLNNYGDRILGEDSILIHKYCSGLFFLHENQLGKAKILLGEIIQQGKIRDLDLERQVRILEIKILYEENDEFIFTQLHNLLMIIRRRDKVYGKIISDMHKEFIRIVKKLMKLKSKIKIGKSHDLSINPAIDKIHSKLTTRGISIAEKNWLMAKLDELESTN